MNNKIIYLFSIVFLTACITQKEVQIPPEEKVSIPSKPSFNLEEIHKGLTGNFIFYISQTENKGDIWLYNLDLNSKWQITSENKINMNIISFSPDYKYIIYNQNNIFNLQTRTKIDECPFYYNSSKPLAISKVNWLSTNLFYCLATTNSITTNIFIAQRVDNKWCFQPLKFTQYTMDEAMKYCLSLSPNKEWLTFISLDSINILNIFAYNIDSKELKKLIMAKSKSDLIWSEKNNRIYFYEDSYIYSISLNGEKKLEIAETYELLKLLPYPKINYKFFYITKWMNSFIVNLKNTDLLGPGDQVFQTYNLRDLTVYENPDIIYFDNRSDEIYYYNISTSETKKILEMAALFSYTY